MIKEAERTKEFEVFTAVKIQVEVFWAVTPRGVVVGYHHLTHTTLHGVTTQKNLSLTGTY
jgi:hypothetical protein